MDEMGLYCLYDRVAEDFGPLFEAHTDGAAIRKVRALAAKEKFPDADYWLYAVGSVQRDQKKVNLVAHEMREVNWRTEAVE